MKEAVTKAKVSRRGHGLLSPACTSWDMYANYSKRKTFKVGNGAETGAGLLEAGKSSLENFNLQATWAIPLILSCIGVLMISSVTAQLTINQGRTPFFYGLKQLQWLLVGLGGMIACTLPPVSFWRRWSGVIWAGAVLLMALTLLPVLGRSGGGSSRWVRIGPLSLQASEVMLLAAAVHLAKKLNEPGLTRVRAMGRTLLIFALSAWPFLFQTDLGGAIILFALSMAVFVQVFGWALPLVAGSIASMAVFLPAVLLGRYRVERIASFLILERSSGAGFKPQGFIALRQREPVRSGHRAQLQKSVPAGGAHRFHTGRHRRGIRNGRDLFGSSSFRHSVADPVSLLSFREGWV